MRWFFSFFAIAILLSSCVEKPGIKISEFSPEGKRDRYQVLTLRDLKMTIAVANQNQNPDDLYGLFPLNYSEGGSMPKALKNQEGQGLTQLIKDGKEHNTGGSFQTYQMALIQKGSTYELIFTADNAEVSHYTLQDDLVEYGVDQAWALNYAGRNNGWYQYGGAQINITHKTVKNSAPDAWLVLSGK